MNPALIVIDMLRDSVEGPAHLGIAAQARKIIPGIKRLREGFRQAGWPVIFACDSFMEGDFIFRGNLKPHSIRGTSGAKVITELEPGEGDIVLEKRRMSAFFRTDLDITLQTLGVDTVVLAGIATHICVLLTAFDAVSTGFRAVIVEDCCAAHREEIHRQAVELYRKTPLYPLLSFMTSREFWAKHKDLCPEP